jgi:hypothetical protein
MAPWWSHLRLWAIAAAEKFQVELYGRYSTDRVRKLAVYHQATTPRRAILILLITAIPCLVMPTLLDIGHLHRPYNGLEDNKLFFVRLGSVWWIFGFIAVIQGGHFVSSISLTFRELTIAATVASLGTTGIEYVIATAVGFPLPFTIVLGAPFWVLFLAISVMLIWLRRLQTRPEAWPQIVSLLKVWACQCCLVAIYPGYFYIFTSLPDKYQLPFACLLPIIKVLVRNWLSRALEHLKDEMSEHVLLNADVFSALFVAYCMQTVPSLWATAGLMAIDFAQIFVAVRDVKRFLVEINKLRTQLISRNTTTGETRLRSTGEEVDPSTEPTLNHPIVAPIDYSTSSSILELANEIITRHLGASSILVQKKTSHAVYAVVKGSSASAGHVPRLLPSHLLRKVVPGRVLGGSSEQKYAQTPSNGHPRRTDSVLASTVLTLPPLEREFVDAVGRLLFFAEFLLLLNYIEVVIPIIYCTSGFALLKVWYPNRK